MQRAKMWRIIIINGKFHKIVKSLASCCLSKGIVSVTLLQHRCVHSAINSTDKVTSVSMDSDEIKMNTNGSLVKHEPENEKSYLTSVESFSWLGELGPGFGVDGKKVTVIQDPSTFYKLLVEKSRSAKQRIVISSLYLGTGKLEADLVEAISEALAERQVKVQILLDMFRGSRGAQSSRTMLLPLLQKFPNTCKICLYHTPQMRGLLKNITPERWNEVIGLQHMKIYLFDDSLIISGANLSNDYFTNRQDRYVCIDDCAKLGNFYDGLIQNVCDVSFHLDAQNNVNLSDKCPCHPSEGDFDCFVTGARSKLWDYFSDAQKQNRVDLSEKNSQSSDKSENLTSSVDTWIFPLIQMGPFNIDHDSRVTRGVLEKAPDESRICLASGYFNLTDGYMDTILGRSRAAYKILMAHPKANGFLGARGMAGSIPAAYTRLANIFFSQAEDMKQSHRIQLFEFQKDGWTFHAKGLWFYLPHTSLPVLTLIGSPNFGYRSVYRDLETQLAIVTRNVDLQTSLHMEQERLYNQSSSVTTETFQLPERAVPYWVQLVLFAFKNFF